MKRSSWSIIASNMNIFKWQECLQSKQNCFYWLFRWWNIRKIWDIVEIVFTLYIGIKDDISSIANVIFSYLKNISCSAFLYCIPFYHISTTQVRDLFEMGDIGVLRSDYWPEINSFYIMIIWKVKNIYFFFSSFGTYVSISRVIAQWGDKM